jgi:hypothetical protein
MGRQPKPWSQIWKTPKITRHSRLRLSDFDPETAVARELVLRLASLLWRLCRANAIESNLLEIQAEELQERGSSVPTRAQASDPRNYPAVRPIHGSTEVDDLADGSRAGNDEIEERLGVNCRVVAL